MSDTDKNTGGNHAQSQSGQHEGPAGYEKPRVERIVDAEEMSREALYAGVGTPDT